MFGIDILDLVIGAVVGAGGASVAWYYHFTQLDAYADRLVDEINSLQAKLTKRKTSTRK